MCPKHSAACSRQVLIETLGPVLYLSADKRSGIFLSEKRGLVCYDADCDALWEVSPDDPHLLTGCSRQRLQEAVQSSGKTAGRSMRTREFGRVWLVLSLVQRRGIGELLTSLFPDEDFRACLYCHLLHLILKNASAISCADFTDTTWAAELFPQIEPASLAADLDFYAALGRAVGSAGGELKSALFSGPAGLLRRSGLQRALAPDLNYYSLSLHAACVLLSQIRLHRSD